MMTTGTDLEKRRREILAAAREAFDATGYAATTVEEVSAKAGVSKGSIYNYFQSKRDLFEHVFSDVLAPDEADFDRIVEQPMSPTERVLAYLDYCFEQMARYRQIGKLVLEFWATAAREPDRPHLAGGIRELHGRSLGRMERLLAEGIQAGEFHPELDPNVAATLILAAVDGIIVEAIVLGVRFGKGFVQAFKRGVLAALVSGPAMGPTGRKDEGDA